VRNLPFYRALLAIEMSVLALAAGVADAVRGDLLASRTLAAGLAAVGVIVVAGHLVGVVSSNRLR
jgi:hypothetical protein